MIDRRLSERQYDILSRIRAEGAQKIDQLAQDYKLTCQSIRRDINALCALGLARRLHGGVDRPVQQNVTINGRAGLHETSKRLIGDWVARDIPDGSTVFMGKGSTVRFAAEALRRHAKLIVVTNDVDVAMTLENAEGVELHLAGGVWRPSDRNLVGPEAIRFFEQFHATHAVVEVGALSPTSGALDFSVSEAQITKTILENSRTRYLVADSSKWLGTAAVRVADFTAFTYLVTDTIPLEHKEAESLTQSGISVIVCEPTAY